MGEEYPYAMSLDVKYEPMALIDLQTEIDAVKDDWFHQPLARFNDSVIRLGVVRGEFHWHRHDVEDEFFLVLDGELLIDIEGGETVPLQPRQGYLMPRGVVHRTRAPERTVMLMMSPATVVPTGD